MELGGALGWIEIQGPIGVREKSLFDAGTIFHVGKNTGFGLGEMSVEWPSISIEEVHDASIE
jgi:CRISPR/Cas system endoribonuclease Cas6 (RAMP superfamily)